MSIYDAWYLLFPRFLHGTFRDMLVLIVVARLVPRHSSLRPAATLHLVAHPVDLLDVGKDHLRIDPVVPDHGVHVVGSQEVGDAGVAPM